MAKCNKIDKWGIQSMKTLQELRMLSSITLNCQVRSFKRKDFLRNNRNLAHGRQEILEGIKSEKYCFSLPIAHSVVSSRCINTSPRSQEDVRTEVKVDDQQPHWDLKLKP